MTAWDRPVGGRTSIAHRIAALRPATRSAHITTGIGLDLVTVSRFRAPLAAGPLIRLEMADGSALIQYGRSSIDLGVHRDRLADCIVSIDVTAIYDVLDPAFVPICWGALRARTLARDAPVTDDWAYAPDPEADHDQPESDLDIGAASPAYAVIVIYRGHQLYLGVTRRPLHQFVEGVEHRIISRWIAAASATAPVPALGTGAFVAGWFSAQRFVRPRDAAADYRSRLTDRAVAAGLVAWQRGAPQQPSPAADRLWTGEAIIEALGCRATAGNVVQLPLSRRRKPHGPPIQGSDWTDAV